MEVGSGLGHDERRTRPADVLVPNWDLGKPAAFDLTVASPLNQSIVNEACACDSRIICPGFRTKEACLQRC